ncbi:MAG: HlyC/CorC family transporter, partial [Candidatus Pacebacteria bacterium]|nr:HlyC/CorC family transporter [Candidatus Paceibacterota bacterium]
MGLVIVIILLSISAIFSGLTLGFFSLNKKDLERKANLGNKQAQKVYNLRKNGNLLLCTLLIGNVAVNSTLSIFLGSIASGVTAGLIATSLIVVFGEIIPQATFSRYALVIGSRLSWLVRIFIFIFYPICKPLAWALDKSLGEEIPTVYSKKELTKLIEEHEDSKKSDLDADEERIIKGALSYSHTTVRDIMTPRTQVVALPFDQKLDNKTIKKISEFGRSRIVVYKNTINEVVGILYVKDLIGAKTRDKTAESMARKEVIFVDDEKPLDDLLNAFKKTRNHLFIVLNEFGEVAGIVTIEDVIEEIIGAEIVDEFDTHEDLQKVAINKAKKKNI